MAETLLEDSVEWPSRDGRGDADRGHRPAPIAVRVLLTASVLHKVVDVERAGATTRDRRSQLGNTGSEVPFACERSGWRRITGDRPAPPFLGHYPAALGSAVGSSRNC